MYQAVQPEINEFWRKFTRTTAKLAVSSSRPALLAALAVGTAALSGHAQAATSVQQLETQLLQIQEQNDQEIATLKQEIAALKAQQQQQAAVQQQQGIVVARTAQAISAQPSATPVANGNGSSPNYPKLIESPTHQFGLSSANGANTIAILARLQLDAGDYLNVVPQGGLAKGAGPGSTAGGPLDGGVNARRARLGIGGTFQNDWAYRLIFEFGGSSDSSTTGVSGASTSNVENAYITYNGFYTPKALVPVAIDLGYLDVPWTLDESTSSNDIMFMERSSPQVIATEFGGGDERAAFGLRSNNRRYWAGAYLTGPSSGAPHTGAAGPAAAALLRASYQVLSTNEATAHIGFDYGHTFQSREGYNSSSAATAATKTNAPYLTLSDRPELRIDPTTILNTGAIPLHSANILAGEAAGTWGPLFVQGEYYYYEISQFDGGINPADGDVNKVAPGLHFHGGYVEGSYALGGTRPYIPATGAYGSVIPVHPFDIHSGGFGALELTARYGHIDLNDHTSTTLAPHLTGGVYGGDQNSYDFGLNWYPNVNMKFVLDYSHVSVSKFKADTTGTIPTTPDGATINAIAARAQFAY